MFRQTVDEIILSSSRRKLQGLKRGLKQELGKDRRLSITYRKVEARLVQLRRKLCNQ